MARSVAAPARPTTRGSSSVASSPFEHRLGRLARALGELDADVLLVTNPKDVGYLTGFLGGDSYLLVYKAESASGRGGPKPVLISDFRYKEELEPVAELASIYIRSRSMMDAIAEVVGGAGGTPGEAASAITGTIAIQSEHMTVAEKATIGRKLGSGGAKRLRDSLGLVSKLRVIKDESEIALIKKAAKIQEQALLAILPEIKPGLTETEIAARLEAEMKTRGSSAPGFETIVAAGANGSLPHYRPQNKKVSAGKPLLIDWGAIYQGYHSDMTRTFSLGKWPEKVAEIFDIVLEAQLASADALAPGKTTKEIDAIARQIIAKAGYAEFFGHGLGHGLGLNGHEDPRLTNMLGPTTLEVGMVVTIEPGIYLPGIGGVRIEDDYVITPKGATNLCSLKKTREWGTL